MTLKEIMKKFVVRGLKDRYTLEPTSSTDEIREILATLIKELKRVGGQ